MPGVYSAAMRSPHRRLLVGALAVAYGYVLLRDLERTPYDDAYFFERFAKNLLEHGAFAWNWQDGPAFGLTSLLMGAVAVATTALASEHGVVSTKLVLAVALLAAAWCFVRVAGRLTPRSDVVTGVTLLVFGCPVVAWTMHTGMETAVALLVTVASLSLVLVPELTRGRALGAAAFTALAYLCRPDVAMIPALAFFVVHAPERRRLLEYSALLAILLGALLVGARLYFGTALPLPFYVKTLGLAVEDPAFAALARGEKLLHLSTFLAFAAPLAGLLRPGSDRRALGLAVASAAFVLYHAVSTTEIMGYRARFYAPALVPLGLAVTLGAEQALRAPLRTRVVALVTWGVAVALAYAFEFVSSASSAPLERIPWPAYFAQGAIAGLLALSSGRGENDRAHPAGAIALLVLGTLATLPPRSSKFLSDRAFLEKSSAEVTTTRGIFDVARCLPPDITLYHSELGVPGLVLPEARIVDLTGLMSRPLALDRPPFDAYCTRERPQVVFLPHRNYVELNREIARSACLTNYERVVRRSSSPLHVRRDLVADFRRCARDVDRWQ